MHNAPRFQRKKEHRHGKVGILAYAEREHGKNRAEGIERKTAPYQSAVRTAAQHFAQYRTQQPRHQPALDDAVQRDAHVRIVRQLTDAAEHPQHKRLTERIGVGERLQTVGDFQHADAVHAHGAGKQAHIPRQPAQPEQSPQLPARPAAFGSSRSRFAQRIHQQAHSGRVQRNPSGKEQAGFQLMPCYPFRRTVCAEALTQRHHPGKQGGKQPDAPGLKGPVKVQPRAVQHPQSRHAQRPNRAVRQDGYFFDHFLCADGEGNHGEDAQTAAKQRTKLLLHHNSLLHIGGYWYDSVFDRQCQTMFISCTFVPDTLIQFKYNGILYPRGGFDGFNPPLFFPFWRLNA